MSEAGMFHGEPRRWYTARCELDSQQSSAPQKMARFLVSTLHDADPVVELKEYLTELVTWPRIREGDVTRGEILGVTDVSSVTIEAVGYEESEYLRRIGRTDTFLRDFTDG